MEDDADTLRRLEMELLDPTTRRDRDKVGELLADEFVEVGSSGKRHDKGAVIPALSAEDGAAPVRHVNDLRVMPVTAGVALVTYRARRTYPDGTVTHSLRSSLWRRCGGRWRMVFHQGTAIATADADEAGPA